MKKIVCILLVLLSYTNLFAPSYVNIQRQKESSLKQLKTTKNKNLILEIESFLNHIPKKERRYYKHLKWNKGEKIRFYKKIKEYSDSLNFKSWWLMCLIHNESRFNSKAKNKHNGASGLIQIMPKTAKWLGYNILEVRKMNRIQQLPIIYKYLKPIKGTKTIYDIYTFLIFPKAFNEKDDYVFKTKLTSAKKIAKQNSYLDLNNDNRITKMEFITFIKKKIWQ